MSIDIKQMDADDLKDELERRGWFVEIMWHKDDVQENYNCTQADALGVLERVFKSEHVYQVIKDAIDEDASCFLPPQED
tara:strand:- start:13872 stop:14108 length:237 start_codon:yes stop_codon:yes gene_type:complete